MLTRRSGVLIGVVTAAAVMVVMGIAWEVEGRRYRSALDQVDREITAGRYGAARQRLSGCRRAAGWGLTKLTIGLAGAKGT